MRSQLSDLRGGKDALEQLSRPGPLTALRGDLGMVGIPGVVFAPEEGLGLPAVAFAHDWLQPASRYADLLRHLATWGIVAAAPGGHQGPLPSHAGMAADLRTTLEVCAGVRLGDGRISVDARRTAFAGHGIGGGVALLAAAGHARARAVVTIALAQTRPSALEAARKVTVPTLHLTAGRDTVAPAAGHAEPVSASAGGAVVLRTLKKATHTGFLDGTHWSDLLLSGSPDAKTRRLTRGLVTAFLLRELSDENGPLDEVVVGKVPGTEVVSRS
ncbi:alpha/beta hydrolase [Pseudonocardia sp. KRD-184]|uniref:Alpha/beta hydrolase n=1 Tax=Pseudonocardia oceani TaxID=2792013 RepID=A0ABS6U6U8_9PSEU|nr:alpha/beta hydrolase [Pseudonocardia oceani]MBW0095388.1 alpha/beta hydrolase [Pseudonocardia oceani]MBW0108801.1 alpha/beta hydrolase [Pseudonocardia oceani]MBW0122202.1 alpha/beta hydrolase [Pseudonocardia oceani]MBW0127940.1 alpha/beta hydrolase [Pseudonocardia oceani]